MRTNIIYNKSCLKMEELSGASVDLLCTDPPYGISFMGRHWDRAIPSVNIWKECLRVLKPGAFAFVMCIPRQDCLSRMIVSLEDAGFNVSFSSIYWCYASGFPKAQNIGKAVDKRNGRMVFPEVRTYLNTQRKQKGLSLAQVNERLGTALTGGGTASSIMGDKRFNELPTLAIYTKLKQILDLDSRFDELIEREEAEREVVLSRGSGKKRDNASFSNGLPVKEEITLPTTPQAKALDGSYGGFQPKPAVEVIIVAMKPLSEKTYTDQALAWHAQREAVKRGERKETDIAPGCVNFDECRIPYKNKEDHKVGHHNKQLNVGHEKSGCFGVNKGYGLLNPDINKGRFPANLLCSDDALNDGKISKTNSKGGTRKASSEFGQDSGWNAHKNIDSYRQGISDSGSFSRYFSLDQWAKKHLPNLDSFCGDMSSIYNKRYTFTGEVKSDTFSERLKELPEPARRTFPFLICAKASKAEKNRGCEGLEEKEMVYGSGGQAMPSGNVNPKKTKNKNSHPTCKPLKLMSWLIILGSQPGDVVLDPFVGSGTTAVAAKMLNRKYIAYEIDKEYYNIAKARLNAEKTLWDK